MLRPVPPSPSDRHRQKINYFLASLRTKPITQPQRSVHLNTARAIPLWLYGERLHRAFQMKAQRLFGGLSDPVSLISIRNGIVEDEDETQGQEMGMPQASLTALTMVPAVMGH